MITVYILTTGGTIEKTYSEQTGTVANLNAKIQRYLDLLRLPDTQVVVKPLLNKDSLEMTDADRHLVLESVQVLLAHNAPIIVTHGTDTMVETGCYLQREIPNLKVPIVFTGAMSPLGFEGSDGLQNLTESLLAVRLLSPGVYLVMHNQVFPIDKVQKDRPRARFISTGS
jgi:L-asparaginase